MVRGNPEFIRNLWMEITPYRLIMMPSVIGAIFLIVFLINDRVLDASTAKASAIMYAAIVLVWGSRVASESVIQEINARTWDNQRMSALGPLALSIGKLFGATIHIWYGGLICMGLYALSYGELIPTVRLLELIGLYVGAGILCLLPGIGVMSPHDGLHKLNFGPILFLAGVIGMGAVVTHSGLGRLVGDALLRMLPRDQGGGLQRFASLVGLGVGMGVVTTLPGQPAIMTALAGTLAKGTGWPLLTVIMAQVPSWALLMFPYQAPPLVVTMAISRLPVSSFLRLLLPFAPRKAANGGEHKTAGRAGAAQAAAITSTCW